MSDSHSNSPTLSSGQGDPPTELDRLYQQERQCRQLIAEHFSSAFNPNQSLEELIRNVLQALIAADTLIREKKAEVAKLLARIARMEDQLRDAGY